MADTPGTIPHITQAQLDALHRIFPDRCPDPKWSEREVWMAVGAAMVIRKMEYEFDRQSAENRVLR